MNTIVLTGKKDLDIYINPQRQRILRLMTLLGRPVTPKKVADEMGISASSAQYHIKKLASLGVVAFSHTKRINGITARYYRVVPCTVSLGFLQADENNTQRLALMQSGVTEVFNGFADYLKRTKSAPPPQEMLGDVLWGITCLKPEEAAELTEHIHRFLQAHEPPESEGDPWEYALIAYPVPEGKHA